MDALSNSVCLTALRLSGDKFKADFAGLVYDGSIIFKNLIDVCAGL